MRRVTRSAVFLVVCAAALTALPWGSADAQDGQPYIVYDFVLDLDPDVMITTLDPNPSFPPNNAVVRLVRARDFIMNPANKTHISPSFEEHLTVNDDLHYTWNRLNNNPPSGSDKVVTLTDQFTGKPRLITVFDAPEYVLAPTNKCTPQGCGPVDPRPLGENETHQHYQCYQIRSTWDPPVTVMLDDQFTSPHNVTVGRARWLCNPIEKTRGALVYPILDPALHFSCYDIPMMPNGSTFNYADQFQQTAANGTVTAERYLCVDAFKGEFEFFVPSLGRWGLVTLCGLVLLVAMTWYARHRGVGRELG